MVKSKWGTKCLCLSCGAKFYDLRRKTIVCPKCGAAYQAPAPAKPRRGAPAQAAPVEAAPVAAAPVAAAPVEAAPVEAAPVEAAPVEAAPVNHAPEVIDKPDAPVAAEDGGLETFDEDDDHGKAEHVIEDAAELGEDEDDVAKVVETSRKGDEA